MPDFREVTDLFGRFRHQLMIQKSPHHSEIAEADKRLSQITWIVDRVRRAQAADARRDRSKPPRGTPGGATWRKHVLGYGLEVEVLCEAFYYFAFRFARCLDDVDGFKNFYKKLAINKVRNDLIEHPRVMTPSFEWGSDLPGGPRIKPFSDTDHQKRVHDPGLYINAHELIDRLTPRLRQKLSSPGE